MLKELFSAEFKQKIKPRSVSYSWASVRRLSQVLHHIASVFVLITISAYLFIIGTFYVLSIRSNFDLWFGGIAQGNDLFYLLFLGINLFIFIYMILVFGGMIFLIKTNVERLNHSNLILKESYLEIIAMEYETRKKKKNSLTQSVFKMINLGLYQKYRVDYKDIFQLDDFISLRNTQLIFRLEDARIEIGRALSLEAKQQIGRAHV